MHTTTLESPPPLETLKTVIPQSPVAQGRVLIVSHHVPFYCTLAPNQHIVPSSPQLHATNGSPGRVHQRNNSVTGRFRPLTASSDANWAAFRNSTTTGCSNASSHAQGALTPDRLKAKHLQWHFMARRDHSALFAGILSVRDLADCVYIGSVDKYLLEDGTTQDTYALSDETKRDLSSALMEQKRCVPIFIDPAMSQSHYEGYCKQGLWPLFHYILWDPTDGRNEKRFWDGYLRTNQLFADHIVKAYEPGDTIWIHDYHLCMVPSMVRKALPNAVIGFFLHTPFPSSEIFRCCPQRKELLTGILSANLIGFQTYAYARHFISSCTRVLGVESTPKGVEYRGFHAAVAIFPIGIDVEQVQRHSMLPSVNQKILAIRELYSDKKIIIGRDKLDQIKGVQHKLNAFARFLEEYPEWLDKVVLIQVTSPTTEHSAAKLETKVSELVSRINGQFGTLGFAPVHHYHHHIDRDEYYALLTIADVALITSVRDGMNTTSHEYVVCQQENHGPLILSEFTGTAGSLSAAFLVNPWDFKGVAFAIHEALTMTKEDKRIKHAQLFDYVTMNTARFWASSFIKELQFVARIPDQSNPTPYLDVDLLIKKFTQSKKRMFLLDYDGTLTPIRKTPSAAVPPEAMLQALSKLTADERNCVYVISGRDQEALDLWLGQIHNIGLSAEHGCFIKYAGHSEWINLSQELDLSWKSDVLPIFEYYTERTPGSFVEQKQSSLTWHYRLADPEYGSWQAKECHNHLENAILSKLPVEVLIGKKNLEVRPQQVNKGEVVKRLLSSNRDCDFIFCAGDDKTDEDMFKMLRKIASEEQIMFSCTIGSATKKTQADWHVSRPEDLIQVLDKLANASM